MDTQYRKNLKAVAQACKDYTDNSIEKLKWELGTYDLSVTTDSTVAYTKTIPTNTIKGRLNYIGGASKVSENLIVLNDVAETTTKGITYSVKDGVITFNGTSTASVFIYIPMGFTTTNGSTYSYNQFSKESGYSTNFSIDGTTQGQLNVIARASTTTTSTITTNASFNYLYFFMESGATFTNHSFKPMLVKGTTAPTEFKEGFENIRSAKTTSVVVSGTDVAPITKAIPSEIQALEGYGWGINENVYNYIDFENKKFIQKVGRVDLGTLDYVSSTSSGRYFYKTTINNIKGQVNTNQNIVALSSVYNAVSTNKTWVDKDMAYAETAIGSKSVTFVNNDYTTVATFKTAMSGIYLYYELATPIETDISQYIGDDFKNIDTTNMGTITFENEFGYDVPSEIDYLIEEVKA